MCIGSLPEVVASHQKLWPAGCQWLTGIGDLFVTDWYFDSRLGNSGFMQVILSLLLHPFFNGQSSSLAVFEGRERCNSCFNHLVMIVMLSTFRKWRYINDLQWSDGSLRSPLRMHSTACVAAVSLCITSTRLWSLHMEIDYAPLCTIMRWTSLNTFEHAVPVFFLSSNFWFLAAAFTSWTAPVGCWPVI